ncbi:hypothetical protein HMPREF9093_00578 [Fusobacterium sp. oral taxon 370 str. F0437]|nr:hypothetical protein HMPREF9093_00578 [Fusobacterium sp. oral taxon 370 str. F0437]
MLNSFITLSAILSGIFLTISSLVFLSVNTNIASFIPLFSTKVSASKCPNSCLLFISSALFSILLPQIFLTLFGTFSYFFLSFL